MKKYLLILLVLSGCASNKAVPVMPKFPEVPTELQTACPDLATVDPTTDKLSTVLTTVTNNYKTYYECAGKIDDWNHWYTTQKKIYESVK